MNALVRRGVVALVCGVWLAAAAAGAAQAPAKPGPGDKCPVCGMFVAKYPDWTAAAVYPGGPVLYFDGAKDLFKFHFDPGKYRRGSLPAGAAGLFVTEYYDLELIDARSAWFVEGSDVYGPMGRELIPFKTEADALLFLKDHRGTRVLGFGEVTPAVIRKLD